MRGKLPALGFRLIDPSTITFLILGGVVVLFVANVIPVELVALSAALALWATGVLELPQVLAGFGDPAVLLIASLFVVSEGLDATGVTTWAGQRVIALAGDSRPKLIVLVLALVAVLTALISVNGAVAALVPMVVIVAIRTEIAPSRILMPLAFAAHAGSLLALTGTPVNVLVSEAAESAGAQPFGFFEFTLVGLPLVLGTIAVVALLGERLLPERTPRSLAPDLSAHARTLCAQYGDALADTETLFDREQGVAELVIPPRSGLAGATVFPGMVTDSGDLVVLAVQRHGEALPPAEVELRVGDTLLVQGPWAALEHHVSTDPDVLVVDEPDRVRRQAVPLGPGSKQAVVIVSVMVVLLATGAVPPVVAGLLAAAAMVLSRVLTTEQAYRGISWTTVVLVGAMIPLSTAMTETGAAEQIAGGLVDAVGDLGPYALLLGLFLLTAVFGQLISNMATALIVIPIAVSAAAEMDVSVRPVMMCVTVAAAAALLTPVATPANLMVMGPGGYRFGDYWKLGLPLLTLYGLVAVLLVPVIWSF